MFELYGWDGGVLLIIPLVIVVRFIITFFNPETMDEDKFFRLVPLFFLGYYLMRFASLVLTPNAWGYQNGEFVATAIEQNVTDSAELLLLEGVPVMITVTTMMTIIRIGYHYLEDGDGSS